MKRWLLLLACSSLSSPLVKAWDANASAAVLQALAVQSEAWNRGDLDTFVQTYAPDCSFVGQTLVQGREQVLARYRKNYPSIAAMGKLRFELLDIRDVDATTAYAVGKFNLNRPLKAGGTAAGIFTLVFHKINNRWLIVLDHTSRL